MTLVWFHLKSRWFVEFFFCFCFFLSTKRVLLNSDMLRNTPVYNQYVFFRPSFLRWTVIVVLSWSVAICIYRGFWIVFFNVCMRFWCRLCTENVSELLTNCTFRACLIFKTFVDMLFRPNRLGSIHVLKCGFCHWIPIFSLNKRKFKTVYYFTVLHFK